MRKALVSGLLLLALLPLGYRWFFTGDDGSALLNRAITAHGGEANVGRSCIGRLQGTGKKTGHHFEVAYTWEETFDLPSCFKRVMRRGGPGQGSTMTEVLRDGQHWMRIDSDEPIPDKSNKPLSPTVALLLSELVAIRNQHVPLRRLEPGVVLGRHTLGLEADSKEWGKVELHFDQERGYLLRLFKEQVQDEAGSGSIEMLCTDYRVQDDIALPRGIHWFRDGKPVAVETVTIVEFLDHVDRRQFEKP